MSLIKEDEKGVQDVEAIPASSSTPGTSSHEETGYHEGTKDVFGTDDVPSFGASIWKTLTEAGVEMRGAEPVPEEKRVDTRYFQILTIFTTSLTSLLPIGIGASVTLGYGMSLLDASMFIIFVQFLFAIPAGYMVTIGPRTGMRQMVQFRYCYGKYGNMLTAIMIVFMIGGFACTASINGAQCLASVQDGKLSIPGAIAIIQVIALCFAIWGYRTLHAIGRWWWIANLFSIVILVGCAGDQLWQRAPPTAHGAPAYLNMVAFCAGNMLTWGNVVADYAVYMPPTAPKWRLAIYCMIGIWGSFSLLMIFGAAVGASVYAIPAWEAAYESGGTGAVLATILIDRLGDFGRFILVILGLSIIPTVSREVYSCSLNATNILPILRYVPRAVLAVVASGVILGVAIPASSDFVSSMITFLSIIGYYGGGSISTFLVEWFYFRKADPKSLDPAIWNDGRQLPSGISAIAAMLIAWAFIIPSMEQTWYTGPIAKHTGDLAFEFALVITVLAYVPLRTLEIKLRGRL